MNSIIEDTQRAELQEDGTYQAPFLKAIRERQEEGQ